MEVTLSRKWAKSRMRGRKLHLTGAKVRVGRARKTRADLEQQLKACRREIARARERLVEAMKQQNATSEMLRIISNSPIQSVLDAVAENAARLCDSNNAEIFRLENNLLRLVASRGEIPVNIHASEGLPANRDRVMGRAACDRRTIHVHDLAAEDSEYPEGSKDAKREGHRTTLATPLLREGTPIGVILIRRWEIRPFSDSQIALLETFADQAVIAIENVRLFEAEKQRTLALAQANRDLAEREANIRRLVEANIIGIFIWDVDGRIVEANESFLRLVQYNREDLVSGRVRWTDLTPEEWQDDTARRVAEVMSTGAAQPREKEYFRRDGSRVPVLIGGAALGERLDRGIAFVVDLTEQKRAEEALRESADALRRSEAHLAEAQRLSHTGSAIYNATTILHWSEETYRIWGFDPLQGVPSRAEAVKRIHPDDRDRALEEAEHAWREKRGYSLEYRIVLPDGTVKHLEANSRPVFSASGELVEITVTHIDLTERKRAERALRESEAKIRRLVDANIIGIFIWDFDGRIIEANDAFLRMVDYDREDLVSGRIRWTELTPPEWRDGDERRRLPELKMTGSLQPFEKEYFRKDRSRVPVLIGAATFEEGGNQGVAFVLDLTERKRAEEALRESEAKFREYAETASDWFWEMGPDYKFTRLTENAFGSDPADRVGTACWDHALDRETEPEKWRLVRATLDSRKPFRDFVYCALGGNGSPMYVRASGKPVFDANGEFRGYRGTGTDVTTLTRAQEEQRRIEARLAQAQRLSRTGSWVYNATTMRYLYWSDEGYRVWGFDPLQGLPSRENMWQRIHPDDRDRVWEEVQEALRQKRDLVAAEFRILLPDGTVKYLEATTHHEFSSLGALVEAVSTHVDVTDRKRAQDEHERLRRLESDLAHMNRLTMMGELAASLAHEITQPIAAARNNARAAMRFLDRNPPDLGEVREALECLVADADRAGDIIDRIRDHIKKAPPRKERFDLNEAINEVIALAESAVTTNGVSVRIRLAEALLPVQGDRVQLQQVVLNLILNAVEAMSTLEAGPRELSISTEQTQTGGVLVSVRDSGPGIEPDHLDRVFEAFYTTKSSGVGMGLSICRSIIDAHGGRLWADMNASCGAVFRFTLPGVDKELRTSVRPARLAREPREDTVSDAAHQPAYEDNKRPHRPGRGRGQRRRGGQ
jgi:PAS domain S-box-containing protein